MSQNQTEQANSHCNHAGQAPAGIGDSDQHLWAERTGKRSFVGHNDRGATVKIGKGPGEFSPGELLKLALGGCNAMSADAVFMRALGKDYVGSFGVSGEYDEAANAYTRLLVEVVGTLAEGADEPDLAQLCEDANAAVEKYCTVGNTLAAGARCDVSFTIE